MSFGVATTLPAAGMLGRYQVLKPLAKGGMAEVLLARALGLAGFARYVVIKRIRVESGTDQQAIDMFLDEARIVASLHHRNIVQVLDVGEEEGKYFFVMEYVHGRDVRELLRKVKETKQQLPLEHVISIATAAAAALHHAHEQRGPDRQPLGIVHRDISPGNILVAFDGGVKVVDFGIAKAHARAANTQAGETKGKSGYMSPEQCRAEPVDRRTDVFQLGIVLWELCTVKRLFNKEGRFETLKAVAEGEVPPPSKFRSDMPPELEQIVLKALAKNADDRFQTADELRLALEGMAASAGLTLSAGRLSDYLKTLFGDVLEPWLAEDMPPPAPEMIERVRHSQRMSVPTIPPELVAAAAESVAPAAPAQEPVAEPAGHNDVAATRDHEAASSHEPGSSPEPAVARDAAASSSPGAEQPTDTAAARPELAALRAAKPIAAGEPAKDDDVDPVPRRDTPVSWPVDPSSMRARKRWLIALGVLAAGVGAFLLAAFWGASDVQPPPISPAPVSSPPAPAEPGADPTTDPANAGEPGAEQAVPAEAGAERAAPANTNVDQPPVADKAVEPSTTDERAPDARGTGESGSAGDASASGSGTAAPDAQPIRKNPKAKRPRPRPMRTKPAAKTGDKPAPKADDTPAGTAAESSDSSAPTSTVGAPTSDDKPAAKAAEPARDTSADDGAGSITVPGESLDAPP